MNAKEVSPADEMDVGLLRRGDGMLPIVGLGGSAGGIAALQQFFAAMPADSGMAFVVILHLSPTHESTLAEMFQRSTAMPVVAATDGVTVEPNSVYVIPPGKFLASSNGELCLTDAEEHCGKRVAVDYFFRSLAETHGEQSLAVVLSGAGGDGALGLKRVKELGGLTIAQDPDEAEHPDMPRAAIATGVVDWVLGVKEMPAKLMDYVKQRGELKLPGEDGPHPADKVELSPDEHEAALRDVLAYLNTRTGRDFSCYKRATILRRIARRMQVNGLADLPKYLVYLRTHAGEAGALLQDLLISVTNFFRDPDSFAALEKNIPEMFKGKEAGDTVRVWVPGCATGEEAYSIAILLSEHSATLVGPPQLQVFATDLDEEVIREAREGLYPETIAADVSEERLRHFFIHERGGYRVRRAIRELVLFAPHDLLKDSPFSRLDLVSCRNLLIYLKREAQSRAFDIFHFALRPGGHLFLGTSEAVDEGSPLFNVLDKKQRLYIQKPGPQRLIAVPTGPGTLARALAIQEGMRERPTLPGRVTVVSAQTMLDQTVPFDSGLLPGELHYRLIERFSPPSILVNAAHEIVHLSDSAGRFLQFAGGEPTRNLLRMVHPMLRVELRATLYAAAQTNTVATAFRVPVGTSDSQRLVDIRVTPAGDLAPDFLLVVFEEHLADGAAAVAAPRSADADQAALHLERELVATKAHLRDTIEESEASTEELKASNEELQAMNEELRSATEELETSREELQSINEELRTVNDELKSNVDQLAQSNNDLQNLMAASDIATVFLDRELRIQRFTPSARSLFNFISTDLGRPLSDLSRQLEYPEIVTDAERSLAHLQSAQREVRAGDRWYLARTLPYRTADDRIAGVVLTFLDITELKSQRHELAASEARFRDLADALPQIVYVTDTTGRIEFVNRQWLEYTGQSAAETIDLAPVVHPDDLNNLGRRWEQSAASGTPLQAEFRLRRASDGEFRWFLTRSVPIRDADGRIVRWYGTSTDIHDQKQAEEAIRASEQFHRMLVDAVPGMVWSASTAGGLDYLSRRWEEYTGLTLEQIRIDGWEATHHPDEVAGISARFADAALTGKAFEMEFRYRRRDGEYRWHLGRQVPLSDPDGTGLRWVGTLIDVDDRKRAESVLRQSEARFRAGVEAVSSIVWTNNAQGKMVGEQVGWGKFTGQDRDSYQGYGWAQAVHPDDAQPTIDAWNKAVAEKKTFVFEHRIRRSDGQWRLCSIRAVPIFDEQGEIVEWVGVHTDITDRKKAEDELRDGREQLDFALAAADLGQWSLNLADHTARRTLRHDQLFGYEALLPEWTYETFLAHVVPDDRAAVDADFQKAVATGSPWAVECRVRRADGAVRHLWTKALIRRGAGGQVDRMLGIVGDITDRRRAEAGLRESEQRFRLVADAAPVLIWKSGTDKLCYWFNKPWLAFTGRTMDQEVGNGWTEGVHPDDFDRCLQTYKSASDARTPFSMEYRLRRHDGEFRWLIDNGVPRFRPDGEFDGYIGSCLDVTDYKNAEAGLRDADRRKDEFLATLAHELRNPLAPIRNGLQVMRLSGSDDGVVAEVRSMMERQLDQLIRLVDDLLDVSRITRDNLKLRKQQVELAAVLQSAVDTSRPLIEQADHTITVTVPAAPIYLDADSTRLAQVFSNLLNNSAKYTPAGGRIWLVAEVFESEVAVTVGDNGLGIPAESLPQIFQMFSQVDRNMEMAQGGLGIGLTLVRRLIEMHGGTVEARSDGPGQGSEFTVRLPVLKLTQQPVTIAGNEIVMAKVQRRILVVDDNQDSAKSLALMLKLMGNEIHTSYDGLAAVADAEHFRPDMIFLDIGLPKLNGYDVCRRIREQSWSRDMEIVALTGWGTEEDRRRANEAGFDHHLVKPVELAALDRLLAAPNTQSSSLQQTNPTQASLRVLVVDDRRDATHMLRTLLTKIGHDVQIAANGPSALALALDFRPEVVLLDINMPGMSGLEVAKRIRQQSIFKGIVLIAMTGHGDDEDRQRSIQAGFDFHLVKPADIKILYEILATIK